MPDPAADHSADPEHGAEPNGTEAHGTETQGSGGRRAHLGRGLDALFGEETEESYAALDKVRQSRTVPIGRLRANPNQPRRLFDPQALDELVASVEVQGVLTPLLVRPIQGEDGNFEIVAGERRWRAAQRAKLHEVPVVVRDLDERQVLEIGLIENVQREDLSPIEEAQAYGRLIDEFSFTQEALAKTIGKSRSHVANTLRLMDLPGPVRAMIESGSLSAGHGRALLAAADPLALARQVAEKSLSVRETERLAKKSSDETKRKDEPVSLAGADRDADSVALERELAVLLGMKVKLTPKTLQAGTLSIEYSSLEQLDDLLRRLSEL